MALPVVIPNTFANANASIPLSQLDNNFSTVAVAINGMANGAEALANVNITGGSIANASLSNVSISSGNVTINVANVTTLDATNVEVTNIKAKDGTASATIADSTGVMTIGSSVLTTTDINGGTIDGAVIGGSSAAAGSFTALSATGKITGTAAALGLELSSSASTPYMQFTEAGTPTFYIGESSQIGGGAGFYDIYGILGIGIRLYSNGVKALEIDTSQNAALTGNLTVTGGTITTGSTTALSLATSGGTGLKINNVASIANTIEVSGSAATGYPYIFGNGTDTNVGLGFYSKGSGFFFFSTNVNSVAAEQVRITHTASAVNYLTLTGSSTGNPLVISAAGSDTDIAATLVSKGAGNVRLSTGSASTIQVLVSATASANRYITLTGSNGGNPTIGTSAGDLALGSRLKAASGAWTENGNLSTTSGVASTIFTMSGSNRGRYEIVAMIANSGAPAQYTAVATAIWDGSGARIVSSDGANLTLTLSGGAVQVTQTAGSTQTVYWSHLYIPLE